MSRICSRYKKYILKRLGNHRELEPDAILMDIKSRSGALRITLERLGLMIARCGERARVEEHDPERSFRQYIHEFCVPGSGAQERICTFAGLF
jgi:hypothetical protein